MLKDSTPFNQVYCCDYLCLTKMTNMDKFDIKAPSRAKIYGSLTAYLNS